MSWSASTARVAADAGLLISCASPAASVPSATSASRCRAVDSMRRAVCTSPSMKCTPNGNHALGQVAAAARRARASTRPGRDRARSRSRRRARPRPGSRRPTGRASSIVAEHRVLAADVADQADLAVEQHPPDVGGPALAEQPSPGVEAAPPRRPRAARPAGRRSRPSKSAMAAQLRRRPSDRRQVAVDEVDRHRALADGGGDPLHRVEPHVAGGEHARARWSRGRTAARVSGQRPAWSASQQVGTGDDEPLGVADDARRPASRCAARRR